MPVWIAVHLPHAMLDSHYPRWQVEAGVGIVVDAGLVRACTPLAAQAGVHPGLRAGGVNALCPDAVPRAYDAQAHVRLRDAVVLALLQYTPQVALGDGDTVLMDVSASLDLFGGIRRLCRRAAASMRGLGVSARLGVSPTAGGAWLLATACGRGRRRVLGLASLARLLDALPCASLPAAARHLDWLVDIGCETLAALRRLPRAPLTRRTHAGLLEALDQAYGDAAQAHAWIAAPAAFSGRVELEERIEHAAGVSFVAGRLVEQLCGWLVAHHRAATRLELAIDHERGRHARAPTSIDIRLAGPSWSAARIMPLLAERLNRLTLAAPAIAVELRAVELEDLAPAPVDLFPEPGGCAADHAQVMALLVARLGRQNVLRPSPLADHRPEAANRWAPIDEPPGPAGHAPGLTRPCWLLDAPLALRTRGHRPWYGTPLRIVHGPERIEDGWWSTPTLRDYYVAEAQDGTRYWLFRERGRTSGWFLHGLFG